MEWKEFNTKMRGAGYVDLYIYKPSVPYAFWGQSLADSIVGQIKEP